MLIQEAANLLDVKPNELSPFEEKDYYNGNTVCGFLCTHFDYRYGALIIYEVNGVEVPIQKIYCTPKLHYPFGRTDTDERKYTIKDDEVEDLVIYEKLDGTNICCFSYADNDRRYLSFKTRLSPFLRANKYANFVMLWDEILESHLFLRYIPSVLSGEYSVCFELFGYKNPLTIVYPETPLTASFIFAVNRSDHSIIPPKLFNDTNLLLMEPDEFPCLVGETFIEKYNAFRKSATDESSKREDGMVDGIEGYVFYTKVDGLWRQYKCKSEQMEDHSWSQGGIPYVSILTTAWNALESCPDELTTDYVRTLLLEEYTQEQLSRSNSKINKAVGEVLSKLYFRTFVLDIYRSINIKYNGTNKGIIMKAMSEHFERNEMAAVFGALKETGILC